MFLISGLGDGFSQEEISVMASSGQLAFSGMATQAAGFVVRIQTMMSFGEALHL